MSNKFDEQSIFYNREVEKKEATKNIHFLLKIIKKTLYAKVNKLILYVFFIV